MSEIPAAPPMTRDDVMRATLEHVRRVGDLLLDVVERLQRRAMRHDDSKFAADEFEAFAAETPTLRGLTYGSPEYKAALDRLGPALRIHYHRNRHHPEHFLKGGIHGMDLLDLVEMLADWKAATERHADGSLLRSIRQNAGRFGYDERFAALLVRTAQEMGWVSLGENIEQGGMDRTLARPTAEKIADEAVEISTLLVQLLKGRTLPEGEPEWLVIEKRAETVLRLNAQRSGQGAAGGGTPPAQQTAADQGGEP